ncbi:unnamed protein product, partial [Phaeothamnion confervicola]
MLAAEEAAAVENCRAEAARVSDVFLRGKEGKARLVKAAALILDKADLAARLEGAGAGGCKRDSGGGGFGGSSNADNGNDVDGNPGGGGAVVVAEEGGIYGASSSGSRITKAEARAQARRDYEEEAAAAAVLRVSKEFRRRRTELDDATAAEADEAAERAAKPLRVGAAVGSRRSAEGRHFFAGELCHVAAYYGRALAGDAVAAHFAAAGPTGAADADRLYGLAQAKFETALAFARGDVEVARRYAEALVRFVALEGSRVGGSSGGGGGVGRPERRVETAVEALARLESWDGLAEVMIRLPAGPVYANAFCRAFRAVAAADPGFFARSAALPLRTLARMPAKFCLTGIGNGSIGGSGSRIGSETGLAVAAEVYRMVLSELELADIFGEVDLSWLCAVRSPAVVVSLVTAAERDADASIVCLGPAVSA